MQFDDVLYLDLDFLADKYERTSGTAPRTVISRSAGMDAEAGIPFLKSGLNSQVTKQFTSSARTMLEAVEKALEKYLPHSPVLHPGVKPCNAWVGGSLSIGRWGSEKNSEQSMNVFFEVRANECCYSLLPKNESFFANIEGLEVISPALQRYIQIPVRMLCKVLYPLPDIKTFVVTPYLIFAAEG
jgi:hypothetical protein